MKFRYFHVIDLVRGKKELNELYISVAIRSFSISMIGIFIPIYIYKIYYSLQAVFLAYIFYSLARMFTLPFTIYLIKKKGFKHSIMYSVPILILAYFMLYTISSYHFDINLILFIIGIADSFYWFGYHLDLSHSTTQQERGRELSVNKVVSSIFTALGPVIGGSILTFFGFKVLFVTASLLLFTSVLPLFYTPDKYEIGELDLSLKNVKKLPFRDIFVFMGDSIEVIGYAVIWPLFLLFLSFNYESTGLVYSLSFLFSLLFALAIGKASDKNRKLSLTLASLSNSFVWLIRVFIKNILQLIVIDSFYGISRSALDISFFSSFYDKSNNKNVNRLGYIMLRELTIAITRLLFFLTIIIFSLPLHYIVSFIALASLSYLVYKE